MRLSDAVFSIKILRKAVFLSALLFIVFAGNATTYYISAEGNDAANGTTPSTPWQTINKLNTFSGLKPGDSVLFKCGEIFYGGLSINASGTTGNVIFYGSYGTGASPAITGFTTVNSWTNLGGNIWESATAVSTLSTCNMVVINGLNTPMGRYPNTGYLTIQGHSGNTSITSSSLAGASNWAGAEVVIRKNRWVIDRNIITSQSGGTLIYNSASSYSSQDKFGFFIQNNSKTLDTANEWYYDPSSKKIRIYSISEPVNVQVSTVDTLVSMIYKNYVTFSDISFTGANQSAFHIGSCSNLTIQSCNMNFCNNGISGSNWGGSSANFLLQNSTINHTNNNAVDLTTEFANATLSNNIIKNTGMTAGMGESGDGNYQSIHAAGKSSVIQNNEIDSTGYNGIAFTGSSITISKNLVNHFCLIKDDGGGIYTQGVATGNIISFNIILNGTGNAEGTNNPGSSSAMGIYCDSSSSGIQILNNSVANVGYAGIYLHDVYDIIAKSNTVYNNNETGLLVKNDGANIFITNLTIENNIFFAKDSAQLAFQAITLHNDISTFGTIDDNYYARPIDDSLVFDAQPAGEGASSNYYTLAGWQTYSGYDAHSHKSPKKITDTVDLKFVYNSTSSSITMSLPYNYMDVTGATYNGAIKLASYSSAVLIRNTSITNQAPKANAGPDQTITLPSNTIDLSGSGIDPNGAISSYLWTKISGPTAYTIANINSASTSVTGLVQGIYKFELEIVDSNGEAGKDTMQVTINAAADIPSVTTDVPPVVNAGSDISLTLPTNTALLQGKATDDVGAIINYLWTKISGPASFNIVNASSAVTDVSGLVQGMYEFEFKVTDSSGKAGRDTVQVTVNAAAGSTPVADAGQDQTITLPANAVVLNGDGTDADGTIAGYSWKQISGPSTSWIVSPDTRVTLANNLVVGVYAFSLTVTDGLGAIGSDTVVVNVDASMPVSNHDGENNNIKVYPNPVADMATLEITTIQAGSELKVVITNMQGQIVYTNKFDSEQNIIKDEINIGNLSAGAYVLTVYFGSEERRTVKVIKAN